MRTHRGAPGQLPGAGTISERLRRQRADRAQVDDVTREFRIDRAAHERDDLGVLAAPDHAQLHDARNLLPESHAARAVDAARHVGRYQGPEVLVHHDALFFLVARPAAAVPHREVLQLALAALIADRAIERMVDEQEFHHALLRGHRLLRVRPHFHAVGDRRRTGRKGLGRLFHLHQTHATVGGDREFPVVTEMRHEDVGLMRGIHDGAALRHLELPAV